MVRLMKQSDEYYTAAEQEKENDEKNNKDDDELNEDEIEVANTLLDLPYLVTKSVSYCRFYPCWGKTRRRSALDSPPSPPPPPRPPHRSEVCLLPPPTKVEATTTSPNTPLSMSFSPTESDCKRNKKKKKKTSLPERELELRVKIQETTENQHTLKGELEKVKLHLSKLVAENIELKAKKRKLSVYMGMEEREKEELEGCEGLNSVTECGQQNHPTPTAVNDKVHAGPFTFTQLLHQPPLIPHHQHHVNPTALNEAEFRGQIQYYYQQQQPRQQQLGPLGFDLNVPAEEMVAMQMGLQPLNHHHHHHYHQQQRMDAIILMRKAYKKAREQRMLKCLKRKKPTRVR